MYVIVDTYRSPPAVFVRTTYCAICGEHTKEYTNFFCRQCWEANDIQDDWIDHPASLCIINVVRLILMMDDPNSPTLEELRSIPMDPDTRPRK